MGLGETWRWSLQDMSWGRTVERGKQTSEVMSFVTWLPGKARRQAWAQVFRGEGLPHGGCLGPLGHPRDQTESA